MSSTNKFKEEIPVEIQVEIQNEFKIHDKISIYVSKGIAKDCLVFFAQNK